MKGKRWKIAAALIAALVVSAFVAACGDDDDGADVESPTPGESPVVITLSSPDIEDGGEFPVEFTCDGANTSPPLLWTGIPETAQTLALIMEDVDKNFYHWVVVNMARDRNSLAAAAANSTSIPASGSATPIDSNVLIQGINSFNQTGYGGPCPPGGNEHTYRFRLYALDAALPAGVDDDAKEVLDVMKGHVLGWGELTATYTR